MSEINVQPGQALRLDAERTTSVRGGRYDVSGLPPARRARLIRMYGPAQDGDGAAAEKTTTQRGRRRPPKAPRSEENEQ